MVLCFVFLKILLRLSSKNRIEYRYAFGASFRDPLLKRTKYHANHHCRASFDLKQDVHILVGRRRPCGTPLPTRSYVSRVTLTQWLEPFTTLKHTSPAGFHAGRRALFFALQLKIQPESLAASLLNQPDEYWNFPHRDTSEKLVSANSLFIGSQPIAELRNKRTYNSSSPHQVSPRKIPFQWNPGVSVA